MNLVQTQNMPSRLRTSGARIGRWLLHVGCRKQAFKHALLDAGKPGAFPSDPALKRNAEETPS